MIFRLRFTLGSRIPAHANHAIQIGTVPTERRSKPNHVNRAEQPARTHKPNRTVAFMTLGSGTAILRTINRKSARGGPHVVPNSSAILVRACGLFAESTASRFPAMFPSRLPTQSSGNMAGNVVRVLSLSLSLSFSPPLSLSLSLSHFLCLSLSFFLSHSFSLTNSGARLVRACCFSTA